MYTKQKILAALDYALDYTLDDLSEGRVIDILIDALKAKDVRIGALEAANAQEREDLHHQRERLREEHHRARSDPLYGAVGEYYFAADGDRRFIVQVQGARMHLIERRGPVDLFARQLSAKEFHD